MKKTIKNIFGFKAFSVLLSLSLLLGALWCVPTFAEEGTTAEVWDGTAATEFDGGDGTEANPYKISNGKQLFKMMNDMGKDADNNALYYELTNDVVLSDDTTAENWVPNNSSSDNGYSFLGHLDGKGYDVIGLYYSATTRARVALIPRMGANSSVKNINIIGANIDAKAGSSYAAAITADLRGAGVVISNCFVDSGSSFTATSKLGGIVASVGANVPSVSNCGFVGTLKKSDGTTVTSGGIIGLAWTKNAKVSNCYSVGTFPVSADNANNIKAYTCTNVYTNISAENSDIADFKTTIDAYATVLKTEEMTGVSAKANMSKFNFYTAWQAVENGYPVPRTTDCANYGGGDGTTKQTAFEISTDAQLYKLATDNDTAGKYYKLTADITLNDDFAAAAQWVTAGDYTTTVFRGNLDGNGKTVRGLYVNTSGDADKYAGLFPVIGAGAVISNLTVKDANLYGTNNLGDYFFGVIAGAVNLSLSDKADASDFMKWPTIVACGVEDATVNARYAGGIIGGGQGYAKIESSYSANVNLSTEASTRTDGNVAANGIVGKSWNKNFYVKNCYTTYKTAYISGQSTNCYVLESAPIDADGTIKASRLISGTFTAVPGGAAVPNANLEYVHVSETNDADALAKIRSYILGDTDKYYIVDVNNNLQYVDICDLVYAALGE